MQGTCAFGTGCRAARLLAWLILNERVQPSLIAGVSELLIAGVSELLIAGVSELALRGAGQTWTFIWNTSRTKCMGVYVADQDTRNPEIQRIQRISYSAGAAHYWLN